MYCSLSCIKADWNVSLIIFFGIWVLNSTKIYKIKGKIGERSGHYWSDSFVAHFLQDPVSGFCLNLLPVILQH